MFQKFQALFRKIRTSPTAMTAFAGYVAMASTMIIGIATVPLALKFLTKGEFGLWRVIGQSMGYLLLMDFGVSSAASRMLVGPLRNGDQRELGSWWTVLMSVLVFQSLLLLGVGWFFRESILFHFLELPEEMRGQAEMLWAGMMIVNAIQMPFRAFAGILHSQNRWYMIHLSTIASSWANLLLFAALLLGGFRTSAYLFATAASVGCTVVIWWWSVRRSGVRLSYTPGLFQRDKLRELFGFSSGVFILGLAAQLTYMSQGIVIQKILGLEAIAAFVVSCNSATIVIQLTRRAFEAFTPRWLQLYTDGKTELIGDQWRNVMSWFIPLGIAGSLGIVIFNRSFSELYGGGAHNHEGRTFDLVRALWVLLAIFLSSINFPFALSAKVRAWSIAGLVDAVLQLLLGIALTYVMGASGLLLGSILASLLVLTPFYVTQAPRHLGIAPRRMLTGVGGAYAVGAVLILVFHALLVSPWSVPHGWWPTPMEFGLGMAVFVGFMLLMVRRGHLQPGGAKRVATL